MTVISFNLCSREDSDLLNNIDKLIREETGIPVVIADDPLTCVARGGGRALEMYDARESEVFD